MKLKRPHAHQTGANFTRDMNCFLKTHRWRSTSNTATDLMYACCFVVADHTATHPPARIAQLESPSSTCSPRGRTRVTTMAGGKAAPPTRRTRPSRRYFSVNCSHTVATTRPAQVLSAIQPSSSSYVLASVIVAPDLQVCPTTPGNSPANQKIFHTESSCFIPNEKHLPDMLRQLRPPSVAISSMHYGCKKGHQGTRGC